MDTNSSSIDQISGIFSTAAKTVIETSTKKTVTYSNTIQKIPKISLRPAIGSFVVFTGDYNGLMVMNFTEEAAMNIYTESMISLGIPKEECARNYTSSEVADSIGEMVNQIMGQSMRLIQQDYDLAAKFGQPKALALNCAITLSIDSDYKDNRRIVFTTGGSHRFYMELAMEQSEFIKSY